MPRATASFASDNYAGAHPDVLAAVMAANTGPVASYGADPVTARAEALFADHFGRSVPVLFVGNGSGANVVGLAGMLRPFENVICSASAHINVDECGAPERFLGSKLITVTTGNGKLTPDAVAAVALGVGDQHHVQPRVVSIAQASELGTVYTCDEIQALAEWVHAHDMLLHVDGARLANAAAALDVDLAAFAAVGIDVLGFGGTKNGALGAEAVVYLNAELAESARYVRKQALQLTSKMRFVSAQFVALLEGDLWRRNAAHANAMARRLADGVRSIEGVRVDLPVQSNAVFATMPRAAIEPLQARYPFYVWEPTLDQVRWMTAFDTQAEDVDDFVQVIAQTVAATDEARGD
jgi:threonine aldolase